MRCFRIYRYQPPASYMPEGHANPPHEPQLEGVVFTDGTVAVRWMTEFLSTSLWPDFDAFERVHGHPEYDSETVVLWNEEEKQDG